MMIQTEPNLVIYDTNAGNFLVVWMGNAAAARDPMLRATCANCGHLGVEHRYPFTNPQTDECHPLYADCDCKEFRS